MCWDTDPTPSADPTTPPPAWLQQLEYQQHLLSQQGASITTLQGVVESQLKLIGELQDRLQQLRDDFTAAVAAKANITERLATVERYLEQQNDPLDGKAREASQSFATGLADRTKDAVLHLAEVLSKPQSPGHPRQNLFSECARIIDGKPAEPVTAPEAGCEPAPEA